MNKPIHLLCCLVLAALGGGCVSTPPADGTASAYSVGDRSLVMFNEVVVSLPFQGAEGPYQNLHVVPAAVVNVKQTVYYGKLYDAESIVQRLETRVAARLSEVLSTQGEQSLSSTGGLRRRVLAEAQAVVDEALRQWEHGQDYRVEIVIASMYWTDSSVGRISQQRRGWW